MQPSTLVSTKTVLFIDDETESRQYWLGELKRVSPDYTILEAVDGQSGLHICRNEKVDCVVLDLDLPDTSGFEILLSIRDDRNLRQIPVVVLTRIPSPVIHDLTRENGAKTCLSKRHTSAFTLADAVKRAMDDGG